MTIYQLEMDFTTVIHLDETMDLLQEIMVALHFVTRKNLVHKSLASGLHAAHGVLLLSGLQHSREKKKLPKKYNI